MNLLVSLRNCKPGQPLRTRSNRIATYGGMKEDDDGRYHIIYNVDHTYRCASNGYADNEDESNDIVEILPMIDLSTCKTGQKLRARDGSVFFYCNPMVDNIHYVKNEQGNMITAFTDGLQNYLGKSWDHDIVQILPLVEVNPIQQLQDKIDQLTKELSASQQENSKLKNKLELITIKLHDIIDDI